jgi:hypothetical protein
LSRGCAKGDSGNSWKIADETRNMRDKLGFLGTLFASLCCLGVSIVIAPLTAIGLGFLINDLILLPLVLIFLIITLWGLYQGWKQNGVQLPFFLGIFVAILLIPSFLISAYFSSFLLVLLLAATIWNTVVAVRPAKQV